MPTNDPIMALATALPMLRSRFGVRGLWVFGSFARGDQRPESDVDLLVEFDRPTSLLTLGSLHAALEDMLERRVDIGTLDSLRPAMREQVLAESKRVA